MHNLTAIQTALDYIEVHLLEEITLHDVAHAAGYSYYHMTRMFTSILGESVGSYIKKRRLYHASRKLLYTDEKIIDIAMESCFSSPEAFSRAFKHIYDCSPLLYRKIGIDRVDKTKRRITVEEIAPLTHVSLQPVICQLKEIELAGIRSSTSLSDNQLPAVWEHYLRTYASLLKEGAQGYSVCETKNAAYTQEGDLSFSVMIGCAVKDYHQCPATLCSKVIASGTYAVFTHYGTLANLSKTYAYIYGVWLMSAKAKLDDREDFEVYEGQFLPYDSPNHEVSIYLPIQ